MLPPAFAPLFADSRKPAVRLERVSRVACFRWTIALVGLAGVLVLAFDWQNFHVVLRDVVCRSGQPTVALLERQLAQHRIRSIINLRGPNPDERWYQEERALAMEYGASLYDFPINRIQLPSAEELRQTVQILDECPKPVLIHCASGIDRTGLVAAVSVLLLDDNATSQSAAAGQFRIACGNFPWCRSTHKQVVLQMYEQWLARNGVPHSRQRFRHWACEIYVCPEEVEP